MSLVHTLKNILNARFGGAYPSRAFGSVHRIRFAMLREGESGKTEHQFGFANINISEELHLDFSANRRII
jgi:hypothetical protein